MLPSSGERLNQIIRRAVSAVSQQADVAVVFTIVVAVAAIYTVHIARYFFVFDDYALLGVASTTPVREIFRQPLFGFFRPAAFLITKLQFSVFGWTHPSAYIAGSLLVHVFNAVMVNRLGQQLADRQSARIAAIVFLLSPWATEGYLWTSGRFDVFATAGVLVFLLCGFEFVEQPSRRSTAFAIGMAGFAAGLLSKEVAITAPAIFVIVAFTAGSRRQRSVLGYTAGSLVVAAAYLIVRERLLPHMGGAYGDLATLLRTSSPVSNGASHIRALVMWPLPAISSAVPMRSVLWLACGCAVAAAVVQVVRVQPRLAAFATLAFFLSAVPALFVALPSASTQNGRFLYWPGAWFAILFAIGVAARTRTDGGERVTLANRSRFTAGGLVLLAMTVSVWYQARLWQAAFAIAHAAVGDAQRYANSEERLFIWNYPAYCLEGPLVLSDNSFNLYFAKPWRFRSITVACGSSPAVFSGWSNPAGGQLSAPAIGEKTIVLDLPVRGVPPVGSPPTLAAGRIEEPSADHIVKLPFEISGWAVDRSSLVGPGVDMVHVYAQPAALTQPVVFLGAARYGHRRDDIRQSLGAQFLHSGFTLKVSHLAPGRYAILAFPHNTVVNTFTAAIVSVVHVD